MKKIIIRVSNQVHKTVKSKAVDKEISINELILKALLHDRIITQSQIDSE